MKTNGLSKLDLSDLAHVTGGQIYEFFDDAKKSYCYLVPSAAGYATYHNKTEALANSPHLAKKGVVSCWTFDDARYFAEADSIFYLVADYLSK